MIDGWLVAYLLEATRHLPIPMRHKLDRKQPSPYSEWFLEKIVLKQRPSNWSVRDRRGDKDDLGVAVVVVENGLLRITIVEHFGLW